MDALKQATLDRIDAVRPTLERVSRQIHDHPELQFEEHRAHDWLCDELEQAGFRVQRSAGVPTGFVADLPGPADGPTVGICAEYDALIGLGHGCGHNLIAACGLGSVLGLQAVADRLPGRVKLFGTPAEEGGAGKQKMLDAGLFEGVDVVLIYHPHNKPAHVTRECMAVATMDIRFRGKAAHAAAAPWEGINALDAMIQLFTSIGLLRQQLRSTVRLHGVITNGGQAFNVIPELTEAKFGVRSLETREVRVVADKLEAMAQAAALATGCSVEIERGVTMDGILYNEPLRNAIEANMAELGFELVEAGPMLASTDFGNLTQVIPGASLKVNCYPAEHPAHTQAWVDLGTADRAHDGMVTAAKALAMTTIDLLTNPDLLTSVRDDFTARLNGSRT